MDNIIFCEIIINLNGSYRFNNSAGAYLGVIKDLKVGDIQKNAPHTICKAYYR